MPKSRTRKKKSGVPVSPARRQPVPVKIQPSPSWLVPTMLALLLIGLVWILVTSLTSGRYPIPEIGYWNLAIGFGFFTGGGILSTQWR